MSDPVQVKIMSNNIFQSLPISEEQGIRMQTIKDRANDFLNNFIHVYVKDSREKSLAITKLEECVMWANKSISRE